MKINVVLSNQVKNELKELVSKNTDSEICGVLLGRYEKSSWFVTKQVYDNNNASSTAVGVVRTTDGIWNDLNHYVLDSDSDIDYIGEWHTHVVDLKRPSTVDKMSMMSLLGNSYYGKPEKILLLIITMDKKFHFWHFEGKTVAKCKIKVNEVKQI